MHDTLEERIECWSEFMPNIYIVLTQSGTVLSRMIQLYTKQMFSHVSIAFDSELKEMYSFGRKKEHNPFFAGFVHENPHCALLQNADCAIFSCTVSDEQYDHLKRQIQYYKLNRENYKYNFIGLLAVICRLKLKRSNAFFCSQFIGTILKEAGLSLNGHSTFFIKPTDFAQLPYLKFIYIGKLKDYTSKLSNNVDMLPIASGLHIA